LWPPGHGRVEGGSWRDLQAWFKDTRRLGTDQDAKTQLYRRLRQSLPENSPPQRLLFDLYHEIHGAAVHQLPALLPEVWLHWDPQTIKMRGAAALLQLRMDFLLLVPGGGRIVLEVDGRSHYAVERQGGPAGQQWIADPPTYARTMAGNRKLTLAGYEVHRFGAHELLDRRQGHVTLTAFFAELFHRHRVTTP
jgi:very-short-patch-repair endonuclease